jgi:hypothetical protein
MVGGHFGRVSHSGLDPLCGPCWYPAGPLGTLRRHFPVVMVEVGDRVGPKEAPGARKTSQRTSDIKTIFQFSKFFTSAGGPMRISL